MIAVLLALLPGATPPEQPMTQLLALDAAAFTRRARVRRQPGGTGHAVSVTGHDCARTGGEKVNSGFPEEYFKQPPALGPAISPSTSVRS